MSYLALARKWRPRTFSQLVGQDHISKALINSLEQQRLHHAYLFTGTRGVGKTSIARLLAKALNCEQRLSAEPCLNCDCCTAIEQGRFIDLIEIDGASKTKVEDTRELLDNVQYLPVSGRFKIYLIDEVHMLSQHSFNALLKTLEEPPSHVKFLLATTDPQKLPVTILSRCLQFSLRPIAADLISSHLQVILKNEKVTFETEALMLLAKAAKGSLRDALSLLDQALVSGSHNLAVAEIKPLLGYTQQDYALSLLQALVVTDASAIIKISREIAVEGEYFVYVLNELLDYLHQITVYQALGGTNSLLTPKLELINIAEQLKPQDLQLFYQITLKSVDEILLAPTLIIGFEMALLRMLTFKPAAKIQQPPLAYEQLISSPPAVLLEKAEPFSILTSAAKEPLLASHVQSPELLEESNFSNPDLSWVEIISLLKLTGLAQNAIENAAFKSKCGNEVALMVTPGHRALFTPLIIKRVEEALTNYYKESIRIILISSNEIQASPAHQRQLSQEQNLQDAALILEKDNFFQSLKNDLSGELIKNSITFVKDPL